MTSTHTKGLEIHSDAAAQVVVIRLKDRAINFYVSDVLKTMVRNAIERAVDSGCNRVILDFGQVEVMDSCGVELLLRVRETLVQHQGRLCLAGLRGSFRRMLSMMRLTPYFQLAHDEDEARQLLTQPAPEAPTRS